MGFSAGPRRSVNAARGLVGWRPVMSAPGAIGHRLSCRRRRTQEGQKTATWMLVPPPLTPLSCQRVTVVVLPLLLTLAY
jgi:hypothetical protein